MSWYNERNATIVTGYIYIYIRSWVSSSVGHRTNTMFCISFHWMMMLMMMQICRACSKYSSDALSVPVKQVDLEMSSECQRQERCGSKGSWQTVPDVGGRRPQNSSSPVLSSSSARIVSRCQQTGHGMIAVRCSVDSCTRLCHAWAVTASHNVVIVHVIVSWVSFRHNIWRWWQFQLLLSHSRSSIGTRGMMLAVSNSCTFDSEWHSSRNSEQTVWWMHSCRLSEATQDRTTSCFRSFFQSPYFWHHLGRHKHTLWNILLLQHTADNCSDSYSSLPLYLSCCSFAVQGCKL